MENIIRFGLAFYFLASVFLEYRKPRINEATGREYRYLGKKRLAFALILLFFNFSASSLLKILSLILGFFYIYCFVESSSFFEIKSKFNLVATILLTVLIVWKF